MSKPIREMPRVKTLGEPGAEPEGFVCPVCGRIFPREGALLRHERTHQPERAGARVSEQEQNFAPDGIYRRFDHAKSINKWK